VRLPNEWHVAETPIQRRVQYNTRASSGVHSVAVVPRRSRHLDALQKRLDLAGSVGFSTSASCSPIAQRRRQLGSRSPAFTVDASALRPYRIVIWFNPAVLIPKQTLFLQSEPPSRPPSSDIVVQAAFCRGGGMASAATGWLDGAKSTTDRGFGLLMADLTYSLFPPYYPARHHPCLPITSCAPPRTTAAQSPATGFARPSTSTSAPTESTRSPSGGAGHGLRHP
jgi:hypothetical protein